MLNATKNKHVEAKAIASKFCDHIESRFEKKAPSLRKDPPLTPTSLSLRYTDLRPCASLEGVWTGLEVKFLITLQSLII
jgi:hypothetical protein